MSDLFLFLPFSLTETIIYSIQIWFSRLVNLDLPLLFFGLAVFSLPTFFCIFFVCDKPVVKHLTCG